MAFNLFEPIVFHDPSIPVVKGTEYDPNKYYAPIAYPTQMPPRPDSNEYGEIFPGDTPLLDRTQKNRLSEILIEGAEITKNAYATVLASNVQRVSTKQTKGQPLNRALVLGNTPSTANDILTQLSSNRQNVIIIAAVVILAVIMFAGKGS